MTRGRIIIIAVLVIVSGAVFALREPIGCFFYLRSSHEDQIAYLRSDGIYVMGSDGSNQCRILDDDSYVELAWSPDGQQLGLITYPEGSIYTVRPDGSELRQIVSTTQTEDRQRPAWSPDSAQIVFVRSEDVAGVFVVDVSSGGERQIVEGLPAIFPVWSPQGDWIAFGTEDDALYIVRPDGGDLRQLSSEAQDGRPPAWSADGQRIAFVNTDSEISVIDLNTNTEEVITDLRNEFDGSAFYITWSPTGDQIAADVMLSEASAFFNVFIINSETGEARKLTPDDQGGKYPVWSPDGEYLIYSYFSSSLSDGTLYRFTVSTDQIERLGRGNEADARSG